jgi:hypothetical protein
MSRIRSKLLKLARDTRGDTAFVQMIILVVAVALFCLGAFKYFGEKVSEKARSTGDEVMNIK